MNFNTAKDKKDYTATLPEAISMRQNLFDSSLKIIESFGTHLYEHHDIETDYYLINEFFDKSIYKLDKVDVLFTLNEEQFETMVENKVLQKFDADHVDFYIQIEENSMCYHFNGDFCKEADVVVECKKFVW